MRFMKIELKQIGYNFKSPSMDNCLSLAVEIPESAPGEVIEANIWIVARTSTLKDYMLDDGNIVKIPETKKLIECIAGLDSHSDISFLGRSKLNMIIEEIARYYDDYSEEINIVRGSETIRMTTANMSKINSFDYAILPIISDITERWYRQKFFILDKIPGGRDMILGNDYPRDLNIKKSIVYKE